MLTPHRFLWTVLVAVCAATLAACGDTGQSAANGDGSGIGGRYAMASGGQTGVYYPTAVGIGQLADRANVAILEVRSTGGSVENARLLSRGSVAFAIMQNDIAAYARNGELMFERDGASDALLGVAALYPEHVQVVTVAGSGIESIADLRGKTVVVGAIGSGSEANARQVLEAYDMTVDDLGRVERLNPTEAADYLQDGRVDAAFFTFGVGTASIQTLAESRTIRLLPIDGEARERLIERYPFYSSDTIRANAYRGIEAEVPTVSVTATLVATASTPDAVVEGMLHAMFDQVTELRRMHARLADVSAEYAHDRLTLPLHPGAARFFTSELGVSGVDDAGHHDHDHDHDH